MSLLWWRAEISGKRKPTLVGDCDETKWC
jgi:hypothetical protein